MNTKNMIGLMILTMTACGGAIDPGDLGLDDPTRGQPTTDTPTNGESDTVGQDALDQPVQPPEVVLAWPEGTAVSTVGNLYDVFALSPEAALFVGNHGVVYAMRAGRLTQLDSPTTQPINGVWAPDEATFYLAADDGLFFWNGEQYQHVIIGAQLMDVWGLPGGARVWAVGGDSINTGDGLVYRGFETEFVQEYRVLQDGSYTRGLHTVWASPEGKVIAGGWAEDGALWMRGEDGWTAEAPIGAVTYNAAHGFGDELWIVGFKYAVVWWNGTEWNSTAIGGQYVEGVFATGPGAAWVIAEDRIWRFENGASTGATELEECATTSVHGSGPADVWVTCEGRYDEPTGGLYHYDGVDWTQLH